MEQYLILRCHPSKTLQLADDYPSLFCPRTSITVRKGPTRQRTTLPIPILPSFLFLPLPGTDIQLSPNFIFPHHIHPMKRPTRNPHFPPPTPHIFTTPSGPSAQPPPSTFAFCTREEITAMVDHFPKIPLLPDHFGLGSLVEIITGLLAGCIGIIQQIRANGDILLKIQQDLGWQINTCIVRAAVLRLC
jgi:hypothetical protein